MTIEDRLACIFIISYVIYYTLRIILSESLYFFTMKNNDFNEEEENTMNKIMIRNGFDNLQKDPVSIFHFMYVFYYF